MCDSIENRNLDIDYFHMIKFGKNLHKNRHYIVAIAHYVVILLVLDREERTRFKRFARSEILNAKLCQKIFENWFFHFTESGTSKSTKQNVLHILNILIRYPQLKHITSQ